MAQPDTLYVLAAAYDSVPSAVKGDEAVKALYYAVKTSHEFDAAVIAKDADGRVSIVKKHEQPTRLLMLPSDAGEAVGVLGDDRRVELVRGLHRVVQRLEHPGSPRPRWARSVGRGQHVQGVWLRHR